MSPVHLVLASPPPRASDMRTHVHVHTRACACAAVLQRTGAALQIYEAEQELEAEARAVREQLARFQRNAAQAGRLVRHLFDSLKVGGHGCAARAMAGARAAESCQGAWCNQHCVLLRTHRGAQALRTRPSQPPTPQPLAGAGRLRKLPGGSGGGGGAGHGRSRSSRTTSSRVRGDGHRRKHGCKSGQGRGRGRRSCNRATGSCASGGGGLYHLRSPHPHSLGRVAAPPACLPARQHLELGLPPGALRRQCQCRQGLWANKRGASSGCAGAGRPAAAGVRHAPASLPPCVRAAAHSSH